VTSRKGGPPLVKCLDFGPEDDRNPVGEHAKHAQSANKQSVAYESAQMIQLLESVIKARKGHTQYNMNNPPPRRLGGYYDDNSSAASAYCQTE